MTILLLGRSGQVGWELHRALLPLGPVIAPSRDEADQSKPDALREFIRRAKPSLIINAAAYTAVDQAESEPHLAEAVNAIAPAVMAEEAQRLGIPLVHYSTDYVFDGKKAEPYVESDPPNPMSVYGKTKLAGEGAIREQLREHLIFRTSWVYGNRRRNFMLSMLRLARERETLSVVDDQIGYPTWCRFIAQATAHALTRHRERSGKFALREVAGTYHLVSAGSTSWHGFAQAIFSSDPYRDKHVLRDLKAIPSAEYPTAAIRPANSRLNCTALRETFDITPPNWESALRLAMAEL